MSLNIFFSAVYFLWEASYQYNSKNLYKYLKDIINKQTNKQIVEVSKYSF